MRLKSPFQFFNYFYKYLGYRILVFFSLGVFVGLFDGVGLALFIPLLKLVAKENSQEASGDGFISEFVIKFLGLNPTLLNILLLILLFFSLKGISKFLEGYLRVKYQQYFMRKIRISNIDLLNSFPFMNFAKTDAGRIQNTFSSEVARVNTAFRFYFKSAQYGTLVLVYVLLAFSADPIFSFIVAAGGFGTNFFFKILYKRTKFFSSKLTAQSHSFEGLLIQKVAFFKYLKTTGLNIGFGDKLKSNIVSLEKTQLRLGVIDSLLNAFREPLVIVVVIIAIYLQVNFFNKEIALILLSLLLLYRALTFFMAMQEQWNMFLGLSGSLENMENFTGELEKAKEKSGSAKFDYFNKYLILQNVAFNYDSSTVLQNIDLKINKNETIAIVGESGSGKSTLMNIISGLLLPSSGQYFIDGKSVRDLELYSFRKRIGYIPQEAPVFNDNIYNNVTFWAEKTNENVAKFNTVIKKAAIYDFIQELPGKEETLLGNNGINLSGGQKQRITIARELFKDVDFLLMDEATSSLDGETEAVIQHNIMKLKGEYTIIIIAHRLATIKFADRIVLLNKGEIESEGSYEELLQSSDHFRKMVQLQNI